MPKRPDTAIARDRRGKVGETLYSPSAAVRFAREQCNFMVGESTMRLWRANGTGPAFERDNSKTIWYRESVLKAFFARKSQQQPIYNIDHNDQLEMQVVVDKLLPEDEVDKPATRRPTLQQGRPKLQPTTTSKTVKAKPSSRARLSSGHARPGLAG